MDCKDGAASASGGTGTTEDGFGKKLIVTRVKEAVQGLSAEACLCVDSRNHKSEQATQVLTHFKKYSSLSVHEQEFCARIILGVLASSKSFSDIVAGITQSLIDASDRVRPSFMSIELMKVYIHVFAVLNYNLQSNKTIGNSIVEKLQRALKARKVREEIRSRALMHGKSISLNENDEDADEDDHNATNHSSSIADDDDDVCWDESVSFAGIKGRKRGKQTVAPKKARGKRSARRQLLCDTTPIFQLDRGVPIDGTFEFDVQTILSAPPTQFYIYPTIRSVVNVLQFKTEEPL